METRRGFLGRLIGRWQGRRQPLGTPLAAGGGEPARPLPDPSRLGPDDDYAPFLSPDVDGALHRLAMRRLWRVGGVDGADDLDVYGGDYQAFEGLGERVTAELRHRMEVEARRRLAEGGENGAEEGVAAAGAGGDDDPPAPGVPA